MTRRPDQRVPQPRGIGGERDPAQPLAGKLVAGRSQRDHVLTVRELGGEQAAARRPAPDLRRHPAGITGRPQRGVVVSGCELTREPQQRRPGERGPVHRRAPGQAVRRSDHDAQRGIGDDGDPAPGCVDGQRTDRTLVMMFNSPGGHTATTLACRASDGSTGNWRWAASRASIDAAGAGRANR
jgi:hypothetical protein